MSAITDILSIRNHIGFIWDKLSGAGKNIIKTISDHVIVPMKRSWKSRRHSATKETEQQREPTGAEFIEEPKDWQSVPEPWQSAPWQPAPWEPEPWQPLPWTYFISTAVTSTPTEMTTVTSKRRKKKRPARCQGNDSRENSSHCLRRRKSTHQDITTASTKLPTTTRKPITTRIRQNSENESSTPQSLEVTESTASTTTTFRTSTKKPTTSKKCENNNGETSLRCRRRRPAHKTTTTHMTTTTVATTVKKTSTPGRCHNKTHCQRRRKKTAVISTTLRTTTKKTIVVRKRKTNKHEPKSPKSPGQRKTTAPTTTRPTKMRPTTTKPSATRPSTTRPSTTRRFTTLKPVAIRRCQNSKNGESACSTNIPEPSSPRCLTIAKTRYRIVHPRPFYRSASKKSLAARRRGIHRYGTRKIHPVRRKPKTTTKKILAPMKLKTSKRDFHPALLFNKSNGICKICTCADSVVYCSNKKIKPFDLVAWKGLVSFKPVVVDLSRNPLKTITRFPKLPIQMLNLSSCFIHHFETSAFADLEQLTTLDLSNNKISASDLKDLSMPLNIKIKSRRPFKRMQDLSLAHNAIYSLPQSMFRFMNNLTFLDLSDNPLAYIDSGTKAAISALSQLRHLVLSNCELETLPKGLLKNHKKLRWLDLSNNRFTTVPFVLQEVPKLLFLSLERNPITTIDTKGPITKLTSLEELHLSHMSKLQNITAGGIGGLVKLDVLRLNHNPRLTNLDPEFLVYRDDDQVPYWPTLRELHLNNNNLSAINSQFLDDWYDLTDGDFSNNPYVCDCRNQWMVNVLTPLMQNLPQRQTTYQMRCTEPPNLKGVTFAYMSRTSKVLTCSEVKSKEEQSGLLMSMGAMAGALVSVPFIIIFVILFWKKLKKRRKRNDVHIRPHDVDIDEEF